MCDLLCMPNTANAVAQVLPFVKAVVGGLTDALVGVQMVRNLL